MLGGIGAVTWRFIFRLPPACDVESRPVVLALLRATGPSQARGGAARGGPTTESGVARGGGGAAAGRQFAAKCARELER